MSEAEAVAELEEDQPDQQESDAGAQEPDEGAVAGAESDSGDGASGDESDGGELVVTIGDQAPPEEPEATPWVTELRRKYRESQKRLRELEAKLTVPAASPTLGEKPTLAGCDFEEEKFEAALTKWHEDKRKHDESVAAARAQEEAQAKAWQAKLADYGEKKSDLKVADFEEVESVVQDILSPKQQAIIVQGAKNPALMVLALGKNPEKAKELAAITDLVQFAWAAAQMEAQLKTTKKPIPSPERETPRGSGRISGSVDSTLEQLRAEAEKTGNMTKVLAYKRQKGLK